MRIASSVPTILDGVRTPVSLRTNSPPVSVTSESSGRFAVSVPATATDCAEPAAMQSRVPSAMSVQLSSVSVPPDLTTGLVEELADVSITQF